MKKIQCVLSILSCTSLIFLVSEGGGLGEEKSLLHPPNENTSLPPVSLDYPDKEMGDYPGLVPLSSYSSEKGKRLAQKYKNELTQVIKRVTKAFPFTEMEIRAVGFLKSPGSGGEDDRYLSVIMEVSEEYEKETMNLEKRMEDICKQYIDPIAKILLSFETILNDTEVEGIAICPNWMLKPSPKVSGATKMSEGIFVCINKTTGKEFIQGAVTLAQLKAKAKIYARQGDKVFTVVK